MATTIIENGRNGKVKPVGFETAATLLTMGTGLSREATDNLLNLVRDVASKYDYNDSAALNTLNSRLRRAARNRKRGGWAVEVMAKLAELRSAKVATA